VAPENGIPHYKFSCPVVVVYFSKPQQVLIRLPYNKWITDSKPAEVRGWLDKSLRYKGSVAYEEDHVQETAVEQEPS